MALQKGWWKPAWWGDAPPTKFEKAQIGAKDAASTFESAVAKIDARKLTNSTIDKEVTQAAKDAAKDLSKSHIELKSARWEVFGSIRNAIGKMGEVVGLNLYGKGTAKTVEKVTELAGKGRAGFFQRVVSKPFRVAANNPRISLFALGTLAVVGIGSAIRGRAAARTQAEAEANAMSFDAPQAAPAIAPQYQITPQEYEQLQSRMKGGAEATTGHADAIAAARQSAAPVQTAAL